VHCASAAMISVARIGTESAEIVANLSELYMHDMAEWFLFDSYPDGRYRYDLAAHWQRGDRFYLVRVDDALAGFAIVGSGAQWLDADSRDVNEFFVVRRYRKAGVGEAMARAIWAAEPGRWIVRVFEGNVPAVPFWRGAIARYTGGDYHEERRQHNARPWVFFTFSNVERVA
jgi:predicted acetyltransferase